MKTGLHISSRKLLAALLVAAVMMVSTIYAPVALYSAAGLQVGASLYACSGHTPSGGDC